MTIKFSTNSGKGSKHLLHSIGRDPFVDWQVMITTTFFFALFLASVGFLQFESVQQGLKGTDTSKTNSVTKAVFDMQALQSLLSVYDTRAEMTKKLQSGYSGPQDPAL